MITTQFYEYLCCLRKIKIKYINSSNIFNYKKALEWKPPKEEIASWAQKKIDGRRLRGSEEPDNEIAERKYSSKWG